MKQINLKNLTIDEEEHLYQLEKIWKSSQPHHSQKEWLELFPEYKQNISSKIAELSLLHKKITTIIRYRLKQLNKCKKQSKRWFERELLKIEYGSELLTLKKQILSLKILLPQNKVIHASNWITEEQKHQALLVPIEDVISIRLKQSGNKLIGLCPLHEEKSPSFTIFTSTNSCWCFGCNQGGDGITLIMLLHNYSFKEAVHFLIQGQ